MDIQTANFLTILNAALNKKTEPLTCPDWVRLINYAQNHSVLPLFYEGCSQYFSFHAISGMIKNRLYMESVYIILGQANRTEAFLNLYDKFIMAGITPLVLKGLICRNTYGELADHRPSGDEDIYIRKEDFEICRDVLISSGFVMDDVHVTDELLVNAQEISFTNEKTGLYIEVHLNLMGNENANRQKMNTYFKDVFNTCILMNINGHSVYTMNHTDHYIFLFLHFFKHFTLSGVGIRQVIDILMYAQVYESMIDWIVVEKVINEISADKLYTDIITLGNRYLGYNINTKLGEYLTELLLEDIMESGIFGKNLRERELSRHVTLTAMDGRNSGLFRMIFPKISILYNGYPELYHKPYLLPYIWVKRWFRYFIKRGLLDFKHIIKSIRFGKLRVTLLKRYGII